MIEILKSRLVILTLCTFFGGLIISPTVNGYWSPKVSPVIVDMTFVIGLGIMIYGFIQLFPKKK